MRTLSTTNYSTHFCSDARSERGVKLNVEKFKLRQGEVRIIGHVATSDGLGIDPTMVKAIIDMPNLTDVPGVQRLFGLAQYLAKFLPHLSDTTRDLTRNDAEWIWEISQQNAPHTLKKAVASTPVLRYYNLADEVTIQCDASQSGFGTALMQNRQTVAYASRVLTPPETRYAQIERELLAIVFACDRFEAYMNLQAQVLWCITFLYFFSSIPDLYALLDFIYNGVPLLLVDRQMALVRNSDIQCTGSSIVCMVILDCLDN